MIRADTQHRMIECLEPCRGTLDQASLFPREIVKLALEYNATAIFFVYNHPGSTAEASEADLRVTKHLKQALALIDVTLPDHFIVAGPEVLSMAGKGLV